jgi:tol-pal system protein YbgF
VKLLRPIIALAATAAIVSLTPSAALAQRQAPPTPEQRLDRLERQVQQVQRQVFPKGRPADTAGFSTEPAASQSSVVTLNQRLDSLERQVADMLRQSEENGHRLQTIESDVGRFRTDQEQRLSTLEQRLNDAASAAAAAAATPIIQQPPIATTRPAATAKPKPDAALPAATTTTAAAIPEGDPAEDAYSAGFHLWESGQYDQAITTLRAFASAYPKHRRASYANNLIGRSLLDKGDARGAAQALLANYRNNPKGERAPDSLLYLGQALMKLGQPSQACKAYAELDAVYGSSVRADLKKLEADAKAQAQCS